MTTSHKLKVIKEKYSLYEPKNSPEQVLQFCDQHSTSLHVPEKTELMQFLYLLFHQSWHTVITIICWINDFKVKHNPKAKLTQKGCS